MTQRPEIRVIVLDTTGPTARLVVENWSRARALAFHGLQDAKKPPRRVAGRSKRAEFVD